MGNGISSKLSEGIGTVPVYGAGMSEKGYVVTPVKGAMTKLLPIVVELQKLDPAALVVGYAPCRL